MILGATQQSVADFDYLIKVVIPIGTFVAGFFVSRLTMTKKERKDHQDRQQKNADTYKKGLNDEYDNFTNALAAYAQMQEEPSWQDFLTISQAGERYFSQLQTIADATFAGTIPQALSYSTFSAAIKEAFERSIPKFYDVLGEIAAKREAAWKGEFRRANYDSIASYYEAFCSKENQHDESTL